MWSRLSILVGLLVGLVSGSERPRVSPGRGTPAGYALLVGVGAYDRTPGVAEEVRWRRLEGPANDVEAMRILLEARGVNVLVLLDESGTAEAIRAGFRDHLGKARGDELALFYFAGHGQQVPDGGELDEADGYDESIVPFDNLGTVDPTRNVRDDEMGALTGALVSENVVVVLDSCHSGTATRGADVVRGGPPTRPPTPTRGADSDLGGGMATPERRRYVLLSAARAEEMALEGRLDPASPAMGWFTRLLVAEVARSGPGTSWLQLVSRVRSQMRSVGVSQEPQVEGDVTRTLFGADTVTPPRAFPARALPSGLGVQLDGGVVHGLSVGDELLLSVPSRPGQPERRATVRRVELDQATAGPPVPPLPADLEPLPLEVTLLRPTDRRYEPRIDVTEAPELVRVRVAERARDAGVTLVVGGAQPGSADIVVRASGRPGWVSVTRGDDSQVGLVAGCEESVRPALEVPVDGLVDRLEEMVILDRLRGRVEALANEVPASRVEVALAVHRVDAHWDATRRLVVVDRDHGPVISDSDRPSLAPAEVVQLRVHNRSPVPVYAAVIELRTDGGVQVIFPVEGMGQDESRVASGAEVGLEPVPVDSAPGTVVWKLVVTDAWVDFRTLEAQVKCRQRGDSSVGDPELSGLFTEFLVGRRGAPPPTSTRRWGTDIRYVEIHPDPGTAPE